MDSSSNSCAEPQIRIDPKQLATDLIAAEILKESSGNFRFRYDYYNHFFVARYFRDNLQDPGQSATLQAKLDFMADRVYYETHVNIIVFYLYLTKDIKTVERIIANAERIYDTQRPVEVEADVEFLNKLFVSPPPPVALPASDIEKNRDVLRETVDDMEESAGASSVGEKIEYADDLADIVKINIALKTIHILGQVLRNFPGSLKRELKVRITEQCYFLGLRVLGAIFSAIENNVEQIRDYFIALIRERQLEQSSLLLSQSATKAILHVAEMWSYAIVKTLSQAVGLEDLSETYKEVYGRHGHKMSVQLIDISIKLDHFWTFPEAQIDRLLKGVQKNYLAFSILRDLIATHFFLYKTSHAIKQKYSQLLRIEMKVVEGGLVKAKEISSQ